MLNIFNRETVLLKYRLRLKEQSRFEGPPQDSRELLREVSVKIYIFVYLYFFLLSVKIYIYLTYRYAPKSLS